MRSSHFIVVTNSSEHRARQVAEQFEIIRGVFQEYFHQNFSDDRPITIVAANDEFSFKPLLPDSWNKRGAGQRAGFYLSGMDKNYIALRLDASMDRSSSDLYEPIYHEYVHYLTRRLIPHLPRWMTEGLAEFYGNVRIEGKQVLIGTPSTKNLRLLHEKSLLPVATQSGTVRIEFAIMKDGQVAGMKLADSSGDPMLERASWGGITNSVPFPPLPQEFKGSYIQLRFVFCYNDACKSAPADGNQEQQQSHDPAAH